jgi:hypothetical protein
MVFGCYAKHGGYAKQTILIGKKVSGVIFSQEVHVGDWFCIGMVLLASVVAGTVALWRRQAACVFVSGLLLNVIGSVAWIVWGSGTMAALIEINALALAVGSAVWTLLGAIPPSSVPHVAFGRRKIVFSHLAAQFAVGLVGLAASIGVTRKVMSLPQVGPQPLEWIALAVTVGAVAICLWDRTARFPLAGLYALGLAAIGMEQIDRFAPGRFFVWAGSAEYAGFALVTALLGWSLPRFKPVWTTLRIPNDPTRWSRRWFLWAQASITVVSAVLAAWISIDFSFDGMGQDVALFGWSGRQTGCPTALMLVGAAIAMTWQTKGGWRARWQYVAMAAGVLFTSSVGWARIDSASDTTTGDARWLHRSVSLLLSSSMMTLLTSFGLARVLSRKSDWIKRARKAMPAFGGLVLLMLAIVLLLAAVASGDTGVGALAPKMQ